MKSSISKPYTAFDVLDTDLLKEVCIEARYDRIYYCAMRMKEKSHRCRWKFMAPILDDYLGYVHDVYDDLMNQASYNEDPLGYYGLSRSDFL